MARVIEVKAVVSAEDRASAVFDAIAKKIEDIGRSAKASAAVDQLSKALERVQRQMTAVDRSGSEGKGFAAVQARFRETELAVARASQAMRKGEADAAVLSRAYDKVQSAVSRTLAAFERQTTAVLGAKRALDDLGADRLAAAQEQIRSAVTKTNAVLDQQGKKSHTIGKIVKAVEPLVGRALLSGTKTATAEAAEIQSQKVRMRAAGVPDADIQQASDDSATLAAKYPNVKRSAVLEQYSNLRTWLPRPEDAHTLLPDTIQAYAALKARDPSGQLSQGLGLAVKSAGALGLTQDPKRYRSYIDGVVKAQQVLGNSITLQDQYDFANDLTANGSSLSDRFLTTTGVLLARQFKGGKEGADAVGGFLRQIAGDFKDAPDSAAEEFARLKLAGSDDFERNAKGDIKGLKAGRKIEGADLARSDPDRFVYERLIPAFEQEGIKGEDAMVDQAGKMFSGKSLGLVTSLIKQRASYQASITSFGKAQGLNAVEDNQKDPFVAWNSFKTSLETFAGTLASPAMETAASVLSSIASGIGSLGQQLAQWQKDHPDLAKYVAGGALAAGAGGGLLMSNSLLSGLTSGFGLTGAATSLTGAASALSAAAVKLGGESVLNTALDTAKKAAPGGLAAMLASGAALAAGATMIVVGGTAASYYSKDSITRYPAFAKATTDNPVLGAMAPDFALSTSIALARQEGWELGRDFTLGYEPGSTFESNYGSDRGFQRIGPKFSVPDELPPPEEWNYREVPVRKVEANGTVTGQATITLEVKAPNFMQLVGDLRKDVKMVGQIATNGPGSTGKSSPDATAPAVGTGGP